MTTTLPAAPKFVVSGNTIEEVARSFAQLVNQTGQFELRDAKKGGSQYAIWEHEQDLTGKALARKEGIPLALGISVVLKKLTPEAQYENAQTVRKAATLNRIEVLRRQLASLERQ